MCAAGYWEFPSLSCIHIIIITLLQEENFHWGLNFANGKSAKFFRILSMIAYIIETLYQNGLKFNFVNLTNLSQVA